MFLNVISTAVVLGISKSTKIIYLFSLINVIFSFYLAFVSGSRQSLIAIIFSIFIIIIINRHMRGVKGVNFKGIMFTIVFMFIILNLLQIEEVNRWIEDRFIDKTTEQLTNGDIRTNIYIEAINDVKNDLLFGTGPGTYHQVSLLGMHTHNGYLYMMNNFGVIPVIIIVLFFSFIAFKGIGEKSIIYENRKQDIFVLLFTSFLVFLIMNLFRDLITMLSFWMAVVLIIDCFDAKTIKV
ncbi:O-antigen ligase family protein [Oceanobacillus polygoni]|uniref:O-antigen ligase n=1 Tax=Oceanobacillus polygoni TaxID=1235259 RepID=A0A9X0YMU4_9BACI|nr:O-antigen ligase family protein [Oceanobacillus polygoni]MBP2075893.1 O-antigen ligase [Oceanobacillus polygoni]